MSPVAAVPEVVLTAPVAKLASAACTFLAALAVVAAGAVLFVAVMMPFVFPLFLVGAALVTHRRSRRAAACADSKAIPTRQREAVADPHLALPIPVTGS